MKHVRNEKRLVRIRVTREWATNLFRGDVGIVAGLPDDVTIDNIYANEALDTIVFTLHSDSFPVVGEGQEIPIQTAVSANVEFDDPIN